MRHVRWLPLALWTACTSSAPPAGSPDPALSASAATAVATVAPAGPVAPEGSCLAKPVTLQGAFAPKPLDPSLPGQLKACASDPDGVCRYQIAQAYYEANRFEDAVPILRELYAADLKGEMSVYAGQLYLESLSLLATSTVPPRPVCLEDMAAGAAMLKTRYCATPASGRIGDLCAVVGRVDLEARRRAAEKLVKEAEAAGAKAPPLQRKAGDAFMALFNQYCAFRRPTPKQEPEAPPGWTGNRCDDLVYNAMTSYQAAKAPALAAKARAALLDPVNRLDKTDLAKKAAAAK
jgi:hypothetical protein